MDTVQTKYKYAVIATDVAIFTVHDNTLKVLLIKMKKEPFIGTWALPGGLIKTDKSLEAAAARILREKTGIQGVYLEQLATFGHAGRDPFGRVVSVAYFALIPSDQSRSNTNPEHDDIAWFPVANVPQLAYDHEDMLRVAVQQLKNRLEYSNIAYSLLPFEFTLTELQRLYEAILGYSLDKRNFRKRVSENGLLKRLRKKRTGTANRPAQLYQFAKRTPEVMQVL